MYIPLLITAWKVSKYGVISGPYFPVFSPNVEKYGPDITPYLETFHAVDVSYGFVLWMSFDPFTFDFSVYHGVVENVLLHFMTCDSNLATG